MASSGSVPTAEDFAALMEKVSALEAKAAGMNSGDTAWMLTSSAIVLLMTLPGLALFYGGMSQAKNVLSILMNTFTLACFISVLWLMMGYSLCFSTGSPVFGDASRFWFIGTTDVPNQQSPSRLGVSSAHPLAPTIPETVFITFQMTFAIITAAIVCGAFAERMKFSAMIVFMFFWHFLVYCPVAHSEWAMDGFLAAAGDLDFAGGNVVHISSGFSGLAASIIIGPRLHYGTEELRPHNLVYTLIGGCLLWVGWFGFNAGSAVAANGTAGMAMLVTQLSAATGGMTWVILEKCTTGKPGTFGIVSGAVTGLVLITPASGYVDQTAAVVMAIIGTPVVFFGLKVKKWLGYDDAMDAFGVHGVGGVMGGIMTGFFANDFISGNVEKRGVFYGKPVQLGLQIYAIVVVAAWSFFMTSVILLILKKTMGIRVDHDTELEGLDISEHGETAMYETKPLPPAPHAPPHYPPVIGAPLPMHHQVLHNVAPTPRQSYPNGSHADVAFQGGSAPMLRGQAWPEGSGMHHA